MGHDLPKDPADWKELDDVLRGHCADVGREETDITRSVHLGFADDDAPAALRDLADSFFDAGVDIVVWSMRGAVDAGRLEPLANALS